MLILIAEEGPPHGCTLIPLASAFGLEWLPARGHGRRVLGVFTHEVHADASSFSRVKRLEVELLVVQKMGV